MTSGPTAGAGRHGPVAGGEDLDVGGDGVRLRGTRWSGAGTPVLLLHGLASSRRIWDLVVPSLDGLAVLALDQRGHGDSDPGDGYGFPALVADAVAVLDELGLDRVVVVGHSWGAWTALALAATHPDRVAAVVALDGGLTRPSGDREDNRRRMEPPRTAMPLADLLPRIAAGPLADVWSPEVEQSVLAIFEVGDDGLARTRFPFEAHMQVVDAILDHDAHAVLDEVGCPVWAVACEPVGAAADPLWGAAREQGLTEAARRLARPRLLRWAGAVHDVPLQWPELVAGLVRSAATEADRPVRPPERPSR